MNNRIPIPTTVIDYSFSDVMRRRHPGGNRGGFQPGLHKLYMPHWTPASAGVTDRKPSIDSTEHVRSQQKGSFH